MIKYFFCLLFLILNGCTHKSDDKFIIKQELVQKWTKKLDEDAYPYKSPFVARFTKDKKHLSFVAVKHETNISSATFKLIREELLEFEPELIIIEGAFPEDGQPPVWILKDYNSNKLKSAREVAEKGESYYTAFLAIQNNIPIIGVEPSPGNAFDWLKNQDCFFDAYDLVNLGILRNFYYWKEKNKGQPVNKFFESVYLHIPDLYAENHETPDILRWYELHQGKKFNTTTFNYDEISPLCEPQASYLQKVSCYLKLHRDIFIASNIAKALNNHNKVMVVYGAGHYRQQRKAIEDMLGNPIKYKRID
jgi:hypothetical protein